jgi:hypothetical protein
MRCGDVCKRRCEIELLVAVLIVLILVFGFGGFYVGRPGYVGPGGGLSTLLYILSEYDQHAERGWSGGTLGS